MSWLDYGEVYALPGTTPPRPSNGPELVTGPSSGLTIVIQATIEHTRWLWKSFDALLVGVAVPLAALLTAGALVTYGWVKNFDDGVASAGSLLELAGVALVAVNLLDLARRFKTGSVLGWFREGWRARPSRMNKAEDTTIHARAGQAVGGFGQVAVAVGVDANDLRARLDLAEREIAQLQRNARESQARFQNEIDAVRIAMSNDLAAARRRVIELEGTLRDTAAGSIRWETVGAAWLALGIVLSGFSAGIAPILRPALKLIWPALP